MSRERAIERIVHRCFTVPRPEQPVTEDVRASLRQILTEELPPTVWQPMETHDKSRKPILVALIRDGKVWRCDVATFNGLGYYSVGGGHACHWRTHWMPLPAPPDGQEGR